MYVSFMGVNNYHSIVVGYQGEEGVVNVWNDQARTRPGRSIH